MTATLPLYDLGSLALFFAMWVALAVVSCAVWHHLACHWRDTGSGQPVRPPPHVRVIPGVYDQDQEP